MQTRLLAAILLLTLSQAPEMASAQNKLLIVSSHGKVSGSLKEALMVLNINRKNVSARQRDIITVTREADAASPQLYQMCGSSEVLPQVVFTVYKSGDASKYKTITLRNAILTKINGQKTSKPASGKQTEEVISFTFQAIDVVYDAVSTSTSDDWTTPTQ
jgi:type VI secretion system Hcp family effector